MQSSQSPRTTVKEFRRTGKFFAEKRARQFAKVRRERNREKIIDAWKETHNRIVGSTIGAEMDAFNDASDQLAQAIEAGDEGDVMAAMLYFRHTIPIHDQIPAFKEWCLNGNILEKFIVVVRDRRFSNVSRCAMLRALHDFVEFDNLVPTIIEMIHNGRLIEWILEYLGQARIEASIEYEMAMHCFRFMESYFSAVDGESLYKLFLIFDPILHNLFRLVERKERLDTDHDFLGDLYGMTLSLCEAIVRCQTTAAAAAPSPSFSPNDDIKIQIEALWTIATFALHRSIPCLDVLYMATMIIDCLQNEPFEALVRGRFQTELIDYFALLIDNTRRATSVGEIDERIQDMIFVFVSIVRHASLQHVWEYDALQHAIHQPSTALGCIYQIVMNPELYRAHIQSYAVDVFINALSNNPQTLVGGFVFQFDDGRLFALVMRAAALPETHFIWRRSATKFIIACVIYAYRFGAADCLARLRDCSGVYEILCQTTTRREVYDLVLVELALMAWSALFHFDAQQTLGAFESAHIDDDLYRVIESIDSSGGSGGGHRNRNNFEAIFKLIESVLNCHHAALEESIRLM